MKNVRYEAIAIAMACAGALTTYAAGQQPYPTPRPSVPSGATMNRPAGETTLVGCLYRESAIPGRSVAQGAGVSDDYILVNAAIASGTPGAVGTGGAVPAAGKMYEVEQLADARLSPLVGKRVQVTGRIDAEPKHLTGAAHDLNDLPDFEATSIREISGVCPAKPRL